MNNKYKNEIEEFIIIDSHLINGNIVPEFKQIDGKILIKHFVGLNTDNFILKKGDGKKLKFSFFKINGIYYININGCNIIDYKKFTRIQQISQDNQSVKIKGYKVFSEIVIENCDVELIKKGLEVMDNFIKSRTSFWKDLFNYIIL